MNITDLRRDAFVVGVQVGEFVAAANTINARGAEWSWSVGLAGFAVYADFDADEGPEEMYQARWDYCTMIAGATLRGDLYRLLKPRPGETGWREEEEE